MPNRKIFYIISLGTITSTDLSRTLYAWEAIRTDSVAPISITERKTAELKELYWDDWLVKGKGKELLIRSRNGEDVIVDMFCAFMQEFKQISISEVFKRDIAAIQKSENLQHFGELIKKKENGTLAHIVI